MDTFNLNHSAPTTHTPAMIALAENDASARYGIRLRHVPEVEVHAQVELEKGKSKAKKAPVKPGPKKTKSEKTKPTKELSDDEKRKAILGLAKERGRIDGGDIAHLWEPVGLAKKTRANKAREFLRSLSMQRVLAKHGEGPGSYYTLPGQGED